MEEIAEKAGSIKRIKLQNFMCHSSLIIELEDHVNFITGQNGSGKSAILTALCVAFGIKARGTQRASSLKDFIKNGCGYGSVSVDIKNEGEDAFKPPLYGKVITVERRITETTQTFCMKDEKGKKVAGKREDLQELLDHFNIEVDNPCVIMTQDKSREFLHAGSGKEKFKFYFKATLLQQVAELLMTIREKIENAAAVVEELKQEMVPFIEELKTLDEQIRNAQEIEEMAQQVGVLKKKLAWCWVYDTKKKLQLEAQNLEKFQSRIPTCQRKIDEAEEVTKNVQEAIRLKQASIAGLLETSNQQRNSQNELQQALSLATREKAGLEEDLNNKQCQIARQMEQLQTLEQHVIEVRNHHVQDTQAEEAVRQEQFKKLNLNVEAAQCELRQIREEEANLQGQVDDINQQVNGIKSEMEELGAKLRDTQGYIRRLKSQQSNVMTTFGGDKVLKLLQTVEAQSRGFTSPPVGPLGSHTALVGNDKWSLAIEVAVGKLLNAFIVTNQKDMLLLRKCAQWSNYGYVQIIIYDFDRPPLQLPPHLLPDSSLRTVMSVLQSDNHVVMNVLVDQGSIERQVLAKDYNEGKLIAFGNSHLGNNVKEVLTADGIKLFSRNGSETILNRDRRVQGRLGVHVGHQLETAEVEASALQETIHSAENRKRAAADSAHNFQMRLQAMKRRRQDFQRNVTGLELQLRDMQNAAQAESVMNIESDVNELEGEISKAKEGIQANEDMLVKLTFSLQRAQEKVDAAKAHFDALRESARGDIEATKVAEEELLTLEEELRTAVLALEHFQKIMQTRVLPDICEAEKAVENLHKELEETTGKVSQVCPEEEVTGLGGVDKSPQEYSIILCRLQDRVRREERNNEPLEDLENKRQKIERRVVKKELTYKSLKGKLELLDGTYQIRLKKFQKNAIRLRQQLTWQFNGHLRKKGFSGSVKVDYSTETLSLEVQMPQDVSNSAVRDTRALSGGERSYSTLSFALALHEMTEAPFRAMDEFDVFMDAISRKISLDTVVDFAVQQGSQWIFITPHDISSVKAGPFVRKQQMSAPRP
jgi:chromosome segregation ATPase